MILPVGGFQACKPLAIAASVAENSRQA